MIRRILQLVRKDYNLFGFWRMITDWTTEKLKRKRSRNVYKWKILLGFLLYFQSFTLCLLLCLSSCVSEGFTWYHYACLLGDCQNIIATCYKNTAWYQNIIAISHAFWLFVRALLLGIIYSCWASYTIHWHWSHCFTFFQGRRGHVLLNCW